MYLLHTLLTYRYDLLLLRLQVVRCCCIHEKGQLPWAARIHTVGKSILWSVYMVVPVCAL